MMKRNKEPFAFESWCQKELSRLLKFQVGEDLVQYLLSMETEKDICEYVQDLLGGGSKEVSNFQREFFRHWRPPERAPSPFSVKLKEDVIMEELVRTSEEDMCLFADKSSEQCDSKDVTPPPGFKPPSKSNSSSTNSESHRPGKSNSSNKSRQSSQSSYTSGNAMRTTTYGTSQSGSTTRQTGFGGKQKQKFVPLLSAEGQNRITTQLPGRHQCQCLGQKHMLVNNCIECGRIVCSQEGSGPCMFCGALVCTPEEEELLTRESKKGLKFREKFLRQFQFQDRSRALDHIQKVDEQSTGLNRAVELKDKLLQYDQTSVSRTKVIDDAMDYFAVDSNRWLTTKEREALKNKQEALMELKNTSRRNKPVTFDIAGRRVIEDKTTVDMYSEEHAKDALSGVHKKKSSNGWNSSGEAVLTSHAGAIYNPAIPFDPPKYQESHKEKRRLAKRQREKSSHDGEGDRASAGQKKASILRLQDSTLQEMRDEGKCLSMHQPWASLLVAGIKKAEGRNWYTTHRGRLWIAAASKQPEEDETRAIEDFYRSVYKEEVYFPTDYPTSCLLGCVDLKDCLPQEEYREKFPDGESESAFVFVVENPQQLTVKFPIKGEHKIWSLDRETHAAAKTGCKPVFNAI